MPGALILQHPRFSTLQRVEIAEMVALWLTLREPESFSTLQRVEIAEIVVQALLTMLIVRFSTLQRVEIAEIHRTASDDAAH